MSQSCMNKMETFKPRVMDLDMLSTTKVEHGTVYEMNTSQGKAKMYSYPVFGGVGLKSIIAKRGALNALSIMERYYTWMKMIFP